MTIEVQYHRNCHLDYCRPLTRFEKADAQDSLYAKSLNLPSHLNRSWLLTDDGSLGQDPRNQEAGGAMAPHFFVSKKCPYRPCFEAPSSGSMFRTWPLHLEIGGVGPVGVHLMENRCAPDMILKNCFCKCKSGCCENMRCGCKKVTDKCSELCQCIDCSNLCPQLDDLDEDEQITLKAILAIQIYLSNDVYTFSYTFP